MKQAYPNYINDISAKPIYNLNKWLDAMRDIYAKCHFGSSFKEAFGAITGNWNEVEKKDFETWLDYYQSDNHLKYKKANFYVNDNIPGYFIPNKPQPVPPPIPNLSAPTEVARVEVQEKIDKAEQRAKIEEQRKRIISRLHSAIKHLTSHEGHLLAGEEFDRLLSSMYEILKQFQTINKISLSNRLYYDLMVRQANKLELGGFKSSSSFLRKMAQHNVGSLDASGPIPIASTSGNGPAGGTLENPNPSVESLSSKVPEELKEDPKDPLDELLDNLETGGITDSNFSEDDLEVSLDDLKVEAQVAPSQSISTVPVNTPPVPNDELEVSLQPQETVKNEKDIDAILDGAFSNITVQDVIDKLDNIISIFRNRQLSRELMIIDFMLHKLGLVSLFPELAESNQRLLDSNQYVLSRLEKIYSQLNGTISVSTIDLETEPSVTNPEALDIKEQISDKQEKDKNNKELRKKLENEDLNQEVKQSPVAQSTQVMKPVEEISQVPTQIV